MSENSVLAAVHAAATPANPPATASAGVSLADHNRAVNEARAEGVRAGAAEASTAERARIAGILDHANAKGREKLARKLAFTTAMGVEEAGAFMGDLPVDAAERPSRLDAAMAASAQPHASPAGVAPAQAAAPIIDTAAIYAARAASAKKVN
jgi:hypothetical protein